MNCHLLALHTVSNYSFQFLKFQAVDETVQVKENPEGHTNGAHFSQKVSLVLLLLGMREFYVNLTLAVVTLEEGTSIEKTSLRQAGKPVGIFLISH